VGGKWKCAKAAYWTCKQKSRAAGSFKDEGREVGSRSLLDGFARSRAAHGRNRYCSPFQASSLATVPKRDRFSMPLAICTAQHKRAALVPWPEFRRGTGGLGCNNMIASGLNSLLFAPIHYVHQAPKISEVREFQLTIFAYLELAGSK